MTVGEVQKDAASCNQCELHKTRTHPVFARGNTNSRLMIVGMVPGPDEDKAGVPFVGRAGQLLDKIIDRVGIEDIYITNLVKCWLRPGLPLSPEWIDTCLPYLISQIFLLKPRVILTLGLDASLALLGLPPETKMSVIRGKIHNYSPEINILPTYHPSYLLRGGGEKHYMFDKVVADFELAKFMADYK